MWLALAVEVEPLFGEPLVSSPSFLQALHKSIARGSAFCLRENDGPPGSALMGGLLFSAKLPQYRIGWLAVAERRRRQGVGRCLVLHVLGLVRAPAEVSVVTFGPDNEAGLPARHFYESLGFLPAEPAEPGPHGLSRQVYRR